MIPVVLNSAKIFNSSKQTFDVSSAYKIINLYFNRLVEYSDYQIYLLEKETFSFGGKDFLDIYSDDNDWQPSKLALKRLWKQITKHRTIHRSAFSRPSFTSEASALLSP